MKRYVWVIGKTGPTICLLRPHHIHEEVLDAKAQEYTEVRWEQCVEEVKKLAQMQKMWALRKPVLDAHIVSLQKKYKG